ncbi:hypothetical protein IR073_06625 [Gemella sp. 19428wG2_WT2a]|nr:hypothetical protein [Gemella sp. 19428wG2_WT2a]TFU57709.1 hypothetical protein E4T67_06550 [Gemella sp. WT2a]
MTVLEIVNLGKKIPILNKSEIIKVLEVETGKGVSDAKLRRYLNKFQEFINEGYCPKESLIIDGHSIICFTYPFLYFLSNKNKFQDKRLRKLIKPFSQEVVKQYKLIGA